MNTDRQRCMFADFLKESGLDEALKLDSCATVDQDVQLKYERVDRYKVLFLTGDGLKKLLVFCIKHDMSVWLGADKLCIGYNYKSNMRLSAYNSVPQRSEASRMVPDRNNDELGAAATTAPLPPVDDRLCINHSDILLR